MRRALLFCIVISYISDGNSIDLILPGTKWCGVGNDASSNNSLGIFQMTDSCCREHDMCPDSIEAGSSEHGLKNDDLYTKSLCDCDHKFYNCLKDANCLISHEVGEFYFNILRPQCFKQTYPVTRCIDKEWGKCTEYEIDTTFQPIYWQWFDNELF